MIVENKPGASGNIGMAAVAAAPADGYTLVLTPTDNLTVNQALYKDLPFDTARDFLPLTLLATVPNVLVVNRTVPAKNVAELVAYAKANPGKLSFASPGRRPARISPASFSRSRPASTCCMSRIPASRRR